MSVTIVNLPDSLAAAIAGAIGDTDAEVCVAGTGPVEPTAFLDLSVEQWAAQLSSVHEAAFAGQLAAKKAIAVGKPGRVVFVVHPPTLRAIAGATASGVAGAFLSTFAQVGGIEMTASGVTCNVVVAGWTAETTPGDVAAGIPAGRYAEDSDIASAVAYLVSPAAKYVSGATLTVDGGFVITKKGGGSPLLEVSAAQ